jgi:HrpA-like RNA helicase
VCEVSCVAFKKWREQAALGGAKVSYGRKTEMTILEQRMNLPVAKLKGPLIEAIKANQIMVIQGETGSGKTTQMTQYCMEVSDVTAPHTVTLRCPIQPRTLKTVLSVCLC